MSTATVERPVTPLRVVGTDERSPGDQLRLSLEKRRWARFLVARDLVLGKLKQGGEAVARLADRAKLGGALTLVRRSMGWLFGRASLLRRALSATGVLPAAAWAVTTSTGQGIVSKVAAVVTGAVRVVGRAVLKATGWVLRLFGTRGAGLADHLEQKVTALTQTISVRAAAIKTTIGEILAPAGLPMVGLRALAKARLISAVSGRFLPRSWGLLVRVAANVLSLPRFIRDEALRLVTGVFGSKPEPDTDPTPPATPAAVVDLDVERSQRESEHVNRTDELEVLEQAMPYLRSTPGRSQHAKRKR